MIDGGQIVQILETIWHYLHLVALGAFFVVGIVVAFHHLWEMSLDYVERLRDQDHRYRVRTTTIKDMMDEERTHTAKVRRLRVSKRTRELILDPWPTIIPEDSDQARPAVLSHFYSVPGRLGTIEDPGAGGFRKKEFVLLLGRDEVLKKHKEYSTLLVYIMDENINAILTPPAFIAVQPVGQECFTYEAHFPPNRRFVRNKDLEDPHSKDEPRIKVYRGVKDKQHELRYEAISSSRKLRRYRKLWERLTNTFCTRYHVIGGRTDFGDGHGKHDWFRVTVKNPPQRENIHICWCMQEDPTRWGWCSHTTEDHQKK